MPHWDVISYIYQKIASGKKLKQRKKWNRFRSLIERLTETTQNMPSHMITVHIKWGGYLPIYEWVSWSIKQYSTFKAVFSAVFGSHHVQSS